MRRKIDSKAQLLDGFGSALVRQVGTKRISVTQAVNSALTVKPYFARVPEVQANFAFTKAYLADADGSSAGLSGARVVLDTALFHEPPRHWVGAQELIPWSTE